jgi:hypothetical protein
VSALANRLPSIPTVGADENDRQKRSLLGGIASREKIARLV